MTWIDPQKIRVGIVLVLFFLRIQFLLFDYWAEQEAAGPTLRATTAASVAVTSNICSSQRKSSSKFVPVYRPLNETGPNEWDNVQARAFSKWLHPFPCFQAIRRWFAPFAQYSVIDQGFVFLSPFKTGSTTSVGVHLRLAKRQARRHNLNMCRVRYRHRFACGMYDKAMVPDKTFTWTVIRDPTQRVISQFFYYLSEENPIEPTDANFEDYLQRGTQRGSLIKNHYLGQLSRTCLRNQTVADYGKSAQALFDDIQFIGITERMDESIVALSMILNVSLGDVLYLKNNKAAGDFSRHARRNICNYIIPSFVSPRMREYCASQEWQDMVYWDHLIYQVANRSLDLTIDALGRAEFNYKLERFQQAKQRAQEYCLPKVTLPCDNSGVFKNNATCLFLDAGCGYNCLDEVAQQLGLDN
jgi:Galactose-3-O-sulfotransferase